MLRCDGIRIHPGHAAGQGNQLGLWSAFAPAPTSEPKLERIGFFGCAHRTASTPLGRLTNGPAETSEAISQSMTSVPGQRARPAPLSTGRVMRGSVGLQHIRGHVRCGDSFASRTRGGPRWASNLQMAGKREREARSPRRGSLPAERKVDNGFRNP
jgi:hypothetical protein